MPRSARPFHAPAESVRCVRFHAARRSREPGGVRSHRMTKMKAPPSEILVSAIEHMVDFEIPEACIFAQDNAGDFWVPFFFGKKPLQRLDHPEPSPGTVDRGHLDDPRVSHHTRMPRYPQCVLKEALQQSRFSMWIHVA